MKPILKHQLPPGIRLFKDRPCLQAQVIRVRYENAGIRDWNNQRVAKLCDALHSPLDELLAWCGVFDHHRVIRMWENNDWPSPVVLHLMKLEAFAYASKLPDVQDQLAALLVERYLANLN